MAGFPMKERQAIIDGYLGATGRNLFNPAEFIDWLEGQPDHEAFPWFFGMDDAAAAREHRVAMARQMANGLRITAKVQEIPMAAAPMRVSFREFPAMVSPVDGRRQGGGYVPFDPNDPDLAAELLRQGAQALRSWLARYRGISEASGISVGSIEEIVGALDIAGGADAA
ncbi:hypothetical protein [Pseudogemmobacter sonorensis]|uniref:hypothetical protein n=1 Tax=Pseudogemmobacter sonorensis TaxID=2989681 RepID=UPI0036BA1F60